jgi:uncharacterized protein (DUF1800 family)
MKTRTGNAGKIRQHRGTGSYGNASRGLAIGFAVGVAAAAAVLFASFAFATPENSARAVPASSSTSSPKVVLDKKFKGNLPITELTEDQAIQHALNRLAYGPRPEDIEHIRQIGLEKWIDQQLHPESIDDAALEERLQQYPTIKMSSQQLFTEYPPPAQAAKQQGITKQDYQQEMAQKRQAAVRDARAQQAQSMNEPANASENISPNNPATVPPSAPANGMMDPGAGNINNGELQLARVQGPQRIVTELSMAKMDRAIYSNRQLEAVMEDFWFNHFNVFANKGDDRWLLTSYVRDTIRPHTMGKFSDLLIATAKSPAMLFFLDNWLSVDPNAFAEAQRENAMRRQRYGGIFAPMPGQAFPMPGAAGQQQRAGAAKRQDRGLNENYGREVMELHTVGVDAGYSQQDVTQMAEVLTGWTIKEPRRDPEFFFNDRWHDQGSKVVMGRKFDYGGMKDGEEALKMLAGDIHTAKFICTELARHFVSDNPPPALVDRMAKNYEDTGGDIRSVLHTMIYSPEFWSTDAYRAKVKSPFELVASTARALDAKVAVSLPLVNWVNRMGEPLFLCQPPTGYSDKAQTWVNTGALLNRLNFALQFASDHLAGANVQLKSMFGDAAANDPETALSRALGLFLDGQVAQGTRDTLEARLQDPQVLQAALDDPVKQVNEGLLAGLVLGAPEFQRR